MTFLPPIAGPFDKLIEYKHDIEKENKRLKEENERYRKTLEEIITQHNQGMAVFLYKIAEEALKQNQNEGK